MLFSRPRAAKNCIKTKCCNFGGIKPYFDLTNFAASAFTVLSLMETTSMKSGFKAKVSFHNMRKH